MKVILLRDVAKLGKRFTVAEVPAGYAQNKLIPQGMAQAATPENLKKINSLTEKQTANKITEMGDFRTAVTAIKTAKIEISMEANAQDHLFKAVKVNDIAEALAKFGHSIPLDSIKLSDPIKALGEYQIPVILGEISDVITVTIIGK